jgi:hypothetical protein
MELLYDDLGTRMEDHVMSAGTRPIDIALAPLDQVQIANRGIGETLAKQYLVRQGARSRCLRAAARDTLEVAQKMNRFIDNCQRA